MKPSQALTFGLAPMKHQVRVLDATADVNSFCLFWEMGAGKTAGEIFRYRWKCTKSNRLLKLLIVCPLIVMENWKKEFAKFSNIPMSQIQIVNGINPKSKAKKKTSSMKIKLEQFKNSKATIFITNTETMQGLHQVKKIVGGRTKKVLERKEVLTLMLELGFEYVIIDELHRFKSPTGIRSKTLHILGDSDSVKYKSGLTGSPILNDPADIWSQYRFVAPWIFDRNFFSFRKKYFVDLNSGMPSNVYFPNWILNPGSEEELREKIHSICDRVTKEEVLP